MLGTRITVCNMLIVTYCDAIEEFMQRGNCYKINDPSLRANGVPALGIRWMSLPAMRPNILSLKHVKWLGKRRLRCKSCATKKSK